MAELQNDSCSMHGVTYTSEKRLQTLGRQTALASSGPKGYMEWGWEQGSFDQLRLLCNLTDHRTLCRLDEHHSEI